MLKPNKAIYSCGSGNFNSLFLKLGKIVALFPGREPVAGAESPTKLHILYSQIPEQKRPLLDSPTSIFCIQIQVPIFIGVRLRGEVARCYDAEPQSYTSVSGKPGTKATDKNRNCH